MLHKRLTRPGRPEPCFSGANQRSRRMLSSISLEAHQEGMKVAISDSVLHLEVSFRYHWLIGSHSRIGVTLCKAIVT